MGPSISPPRALTLTSNSIRPHRVKICSTKVLVDNVHLEDVLRPANQHETAAFFLVERTLRRTRPLLGTRGLRAAVVQEGTIERSSLGRLRLRFNGNDSDDEPDNRVTTRPLSDEEVAWWAGLRRMVDAAKPVTDSQWNLVSMRIGPRVLSRLPLGSVVAYDPNGTPPFKGSLDLSLSGGQRSPRPPRRVRPFIEVELLAAIDAFIREGEPPMGPEPALAPQWELAKNARHPDHLGVLAQWGHGRRGSKGKWHRCPICHAPVVNGRFNQRIPFGSIRAGEGSIRDLRGGYLSRLRETYLISDPNSLIAPSPPRRDDEAEHGRKPLHQVEAGHPIVQGTL